MVLGFIKKIAIKSILDKAKELHQSGLTVEQITDKFWAEPKVAEGLSALDISPDELIRMIKGKVKEK